MSIASEISRLQDAKASIKTAIENKGVTVPSSEKISNYSSYIASIQTGGSSYSTPNVIGLISRENLMQYGGGVYGLDFNQDGEVDFRDWPISASLSLSGDYTGVIGVLPSLSLSEFDALLTSVPARGSYKTIYDFYSIYVNYDEESASTITPTALLLVNSNGQKRFIMYEWSVLTLWDYSNPYAYPYYVVFDDVPSLWDTSLKLAYTSLS